MLAGEIHCVLIVDRGWKPLLVSEVVETSTALQKRPLTVRTVCVRIDHAASPQTEKTPLADHRERGLAELAEAQARQQN